MKRGTPQGAKFTEEHKEKLTAAHLNSPAWWAGRRAASKKLKGRAPVPEAIAGSCATRKVRRMGQTRKSAPALWQKYFQFYLEQHLRRRRDGGTGQ